MKKIWKMKKSKEAVSPVIATILMVAITVVLAAVLYVMVMGFGDNPDTNPSMSLSKSTTDSPSQMKVAVASISDPQAIENIQLSMVIGTTAYLVDCDAIVAGPATPANSALTMSFVDLAGDGKVSSGDYWLFTSQSAIVDGTAITMNVLYGSENAQIASSNWVSF